MLNSALGLFVTIQDWANEIYKKVEDQKSSRGRNQDAILAACLFIACRQEDKPRTLELENGQSVEIGTIHAGDFMRRFCSNLGMANQTVKAAQEAVGKAKQFDIRRSPISIAATVINIVTQLPDYKKALKDVSSATGVAEWMIRNSFKDLYPHLSKIVLSWYAPEEDLMHLCCP
ncbi:hypothetical protein ACS0TY_001352 [Phlomoides rotata]